MNIESDTLKYVRMMIEKGMDQESAENIISTISEIKIHNLYAKDEVNEMLTEAMEKVLKEARRQSNADLKEAKTQRRWLGTIIVSVAIAACGYITAAMHYFH